MKTNVELIKNRVKELIEASQTLKQQIDEIQEWSSFNLIIQNIGAIVEFVSQIARAVETTVQELAGDLQGLTWEEKLNAAVEIIDDAIKLPVWLEMVDGPALKIVISIVVHYINKEWGHNWDL